MVVSLPPELTAFNVTPPLTKDAVFTGNHTSPPINQHHYNHNRPLSQYSSHTLLPHKRKSSLSVGPDKARKLFELSHNLVMNTLPLKVHSVFDHLRMRTTSSNNSSNNNSNRSSSSGTTYRQRLSALFDGGAMDENCPSPSTASHNSPKFRQMQDILPSGMLVEPADLFDKTSSGSMTASHRNSRDAKTGIRSVATVTNMPEGEQHFDSDTQEDEKTLIDEKEMEVDVCGTPVTRRTIRSDRADNGSPIVMKSRSKPKLNNTINSKILSTHSPLGIALPTPTGSAQTTVLSLGELEYDNESVDDDDESRWSLAALDSRMSLNEEFSMQNTANSIYRASGGAHAVLGPENVRPIGQSGPISTNLSASRNPNTGTPSKLITFAAPTTMTASPNNSAAIHTDSPYGYAAPAQTQIHHQFPQARDPSPLSPFFPSTSSTPTTARDPSSTSTSRRETKSTLFDWSEPPTQHHAQQLASEKRKSKSSANQAAYSSTDSSSSVVAPGGSNTSKASATKGGAAYSPPRPRTVHGKKVDHAGDPFFQHHRGSARSVGRRTGPTGGLHMRSQSVPVVAPGGENGKRGRREPVVVTNKFGTWGVGSKGVSEDWDDDFDFGDEEETQLPNVALMGGNKREESVDDERMTESVEMGSVHTAQIKVPQTIRDQQVKVVNNIGLVREFGLLIEELKGIRGRMAERATREEVHRSEVEGQQSQQEPFASTELWKEIDAMIELADREVEEPLSQEEALPTQNEDDPFEESSVAAVTIPSAELQHSQSSLSTPPTQSSAWHTPNHPRRSRSRRRSVLPYENDVFSTPTNQTSSQSLVLTSSPAGNSLSATPPTVTSSSSASNIGLTPIHNASMLGASASTSTSTSTLTTTTRPRKDSEAMARSVIEALHRRKDTTSDPTDTSPLTLRPVPTHQKVLFDTNTLRYIVGHVQDLLKKVKADADFDWDDEDIDEDDEDERRGSQPKRRRESAGDEERRRQSGEGGRQLERLFRSSAPGRSNTGTRLEFVDERGGFKHGGGFEEEDDDEDEMDMT